MELEKRIDKIAYLAQVGLIKLASDSYKALNKEPVIDVFIAVLEAEIRGVISLGSSDNIKVLTNIEEYPGDLSQIESRIFQAITLLNGKKRDVNQYFMDSLTRDFNQGEFYLALESLIKKGIVKKYLINSTKDKNKIVYYTLSENLGHRYGKSDFKSEKGLKIKDL